MKAKKTLVLGASPNPERYSYLAVKKLMQYKHSVIAVGRRTAKINGIEIETGMPLHQNVDTVTLYLKPENQVPYYQYILALKPRRIIFNPGTENEEFVRLAENEGIETQKACTLVMLSTNQY